MSVAECRVIDLPKIIDTRGDPTFIEGGRHVPFKIKRVYYLYGVPGEAERGGHAHKSSHELIIALSKSFDVILDDGTQRNTQRKRFPSNHSYYGIHFCLMIWRELDNFSSRSVYMVQPNRQGDG